MVRMPFFAVISDVAGNGCHLQRTFDLFGIKRTFFRIESLDLCLAATPYAGVHRRADIFFSANSKNAVRQFIAPIEPNIQRITISSVIYIRDLSKKLLPWHSKCI